MYAKNITTKKFSDQAFPQFQEVPEDQFVKEKSHSVFFYSSLFEKQPVSEESIRLSEIVLLLNAMAGDADSYANADAKVISRFKKEVPVAVFSKLENGKKTKDSFQSTSLIAVDIDQKERGAAANVSVSELLGRLKNFGIAAVLYTTFSYRDDQPCFRVLVDLGKDCDRDDHRRSCIWLQKNVFADLCSSGAVDSVSWSPVHPMVLPSGFLHCRPIVKHVEGKGLWEVSGSEIALITVEKPPRPNKQQKLQIGKENLSGEPEKAFVRQIEYLHKKLKLARYTASSIQFWRSLYDTNPGLYCKHDWKRIFDPTKRESHKLVYSLDDFKEACGHEPVDRSAREKAVRDWMKSETPYALFNENCGTGKSEVLVSLSSDDPEKQRYIFTFSTRANRDAFAQRSKNSIVVRSTSEIIESVVGNAKSKRILSAFQSYYSHLKTVRKRRSAVEQKQESGGRDFLLKFLGKEERQASEKRPMEEALKRCFSDGEISETEFNLIRKEVQKGRRDLSKSQHLLMTTQKFDFLAGYGEPDAFRSDVIFTDEHLVGMLTNIDETERYEVYGAEWNPETSDEIDRRKLHNLKRCIVTSEDVAAHELGYNGIPYREIASVQKTGDFDSLEVLIVGSTSSQRKGGKDSIRQAIKNSIERVADSETVIIGDKLKADFNLVNCKGSNELRGKNTVVVLSMPAAPEIAQTMACTGLDREAAKSLIMSDKANQAIGRNQGYRNKDEHGKPSSGANRCLLILPRKAGFEFDLHSVTPKVVSAGDWNSANDGSKTSEERKADFFFRHIIDEIVMTEKTEATNNTSTTSL